MIAQEPQDTRTNIPEPSHIDRSTQTDPGATRSEPEKSVSIHKNICILEHLIKISLATGLTCVQLEMQTLTGVDPDTGANIRSNDLSRSRSEL